MKVNRDCLKDSLLDNILKTPKAITMKLASKETFICEARLLKFVKTEIDSEKLQFKIHKADVRRVLYIESEAYNTHSKQEYCFVEFLEYVVDYESNKEFLEKVIEKLDDFVMVGNNVCTSNEVLYNNVNRIIENKIIVSDNLPRIDLWDISYKENMDITKLSKEIE